MPTVDEICARVDTIDGWLTHRQAARLSEMAARVGDSSSVVEIGSYHGRSTIVLALSVPPGVEVVAIDPHAGNDRGPGQWESSTALGEADHRIFAANLERHGVATKVRYVREFSDAAHGAVTGDIALLYIDGAHRVGPARRDISNWGDAVAPGGTMAIHDCYHSVFVTMAVVAELFFAKRWRYVGRETSMVIYERAALQSVERFANFGLQMAQLPSFGRNLVLRAFEQMRVPWLGRLLGHRPGTPLY